MKPSRREILEAAAALSALGLHAACASRAKPAAQATEAPPPQRLLILGGTGFLGPHVVEAALARGHSMTLFNRGRTNPELFPDLEKLRGDRDDDLDALHGRTWDAVIDTSGYVPRHVRGPAELLAPALRQYVFVSTCSVYAELGSVAIDESSLLSTLEDPTVERVDGATYGALKALCEQAAEAAMPGRVSVVRPGLIVGPRDDTDRFGYWPLRVSQGGEVLAPGEPAYEVQFTDVRDLAAFLVRVIEDGSTGVYNVDGPERPLPMGELLEICRRVSGSDARFTWVEVGFLAEQGVLPWTHMPAWFPPPEGAVQVPSVSSAKALQQGLRLRPPQETVAATLAYERSRPPRDAPPRFGLSREREAEVLSAWRELTGA